MSLALSVMTVCVSAPTIWNSKHAQLLCTVRRKLKTRLFHTAYQEQRANYRHKAPPFDSLTIYMLCKSDLIDSFMGQAIL